MSVSSRGRTTVALGPTVELRVWALGSQPKHALVLVLFSLLAATIAYGGGLGIWGAVAAALIVWLVSWQLWLPIHWQIGPRGVVQRLGFFSRQVAWDRIQSAEVRDNFLVIQLAGTGGWAGSLRRIYIPCGKSKAGELYETICHWIEPAQHGQALAAGDSQPR